MNRRLFLVLAVLGVLAGCQQPQAPVPPNGPCKRPVMLVFTASWCGPCRFEFPFFRSQATKLAGTVAFLGVDSQDSTGDARTFLKDNPVPYPSFEDQDGQIARVFRGGRAFPTTAFYNARGDLTKTHVGAYATEAKLAQDIREYATR